MNNSQQDELLTTTEAAALTPFKASTFRVWKVTWRPDRPESGRKGPKPSKVEGRVFYRRGDVMDWLHRSAGEPVKAC